MRPASGAHGGLALWHLSERGQPSATGTLGAGSGLRPVFGVRQAGETLALSGLPGGGPAGEPGTATTKAGDRMFETEGGVVLALAAAAVVWFLDRLGKPVRERRKGRR